MPSLLVSALVFLCYSALSLAFWRAQSRGEGDILSRGAIGHVVLLPLGLHGYLLWQQVFSEWGFDFGLWHALSLISWLTLLVYWVARFFYPLGCLQALVLPLAALVSALPGLFPSVHVLSNTNLCEDFIFVGAGLATKSGDFTDMP